jgi:hypothetical protein
MRFADAFAAEQIVPEISDGDFLLTCTCGLDQRLDEMDVDEDFDGLTLYECTRCTNPLVGIMHDTAATDLWVSTAAMTRRTEVGGHRRNGFVVGAKVDVAVHPRDGDDDFVLIPPSPSFFTALRNL